MKGIYFACCGHLGKTNLIFFSSVNRFGPRFPAMNNAYDARLRQLAKSVAKEIGIDQYIREGVYVMLGGPAYETVAELRLLRMLGIDAVGTCLFEFPAVNLCLPVFLCN